MQQTVEYINETLGTNAVAIPIQKEGLGKLPMFINEAYKLYNTFLLNRELVLVELRNNEELSILKIEKNLQLIKTAFEKKVIVRRQTNVDFWL